ncbi:acyl-CoA thioesterase II [Arachnia propionica]|uniref:Acyl-CoA thioesterase II n=1 Tax=Arachnia propionica TaxID=1750 RepID=A0A3P1T6H7_9ACTN|nr:acyl-CoA thioesterase II [Arachnia propionica]MDO5083469.1 acyl-CoA thioesterase II [Arachnia propionica]RRD04908.1 acyl-CoA thioesterase II [Arachnia propionica]
MPATVEDLIKLFDLVEVGTDKFRGPQPDTTWQRLFGGQVMAQTLVAAMRTVPGTRQLHSLHGYFLRPGSREESLRFEVEHVRDGRTFSARRVITRQHDDVIFDLNASFQEPEDGLSHAALQPEGVPSPEKCPSLGAVLEERFGAPIRMLSEWDALDVRLAGAPTPTPNGGVMRAWVRTQGGLPDDPWLHTAILAYLTDVLLLSVSTVQHEVEFLSPSMQTASIDHAMWFHRPVRCDQWLLYDMVSPSTSGARGYCQGRLFQDGRLVASCAQEGLIRIIG